MAKSDVYQIVTDEIIKAMESCEGNVILPWHTSSSLPCNVLSGKQYNGVNIMALWASELKNEYSLSLWGTYKQWVEKGAQVKKGEKSTKIVFYKSFEIEDEETGERKEIPMAKMSSVFNVEQVEGFVVEGIAENNVVEHSIIDKFIEKTQANIVHIGDYACYIPHQDKILMPTKELFIGTKTQDATEGYYSTLFHELGHWTGHKSRCDRKPYGDRPKAHEEIVAELSASFLCAEFGFPCVGRKDHAEYIKNWLGEMKKDNKFIFKAASEARKAVEFLKK